MIIFSENTHQKVSRSKTTKPPLLRIYFLYLPAEQSPSPHLLSIPIPSVKKKIKKSPSLFSSEGKGEGEGYRTDSEKEPYSLFKKEPEQIVAVGINQ